MLKIDLKALEQLVKDLFGDIDCLAFNEAKEHPEYIKLDKRIKSIAKNNETLSFLYEGNRNAVGHTITKEDIAAFQEYYWAVHDRQNLIVQQIFCYGFILGSNLKDCFDKRGPESEAPL